MLTQLAFQTSVCQKPVPDVEALHSRYNIFYPCLPPVRSVLPTAAKMLSLTPPQ